MFSPFLWMVDIGSIIGILFHIDYQKALLCHRENIFSIVKEYFLCNFITAITQKH